jgi:TPR repeat protein
MNTSSLSFLFYHRVLKRVALNDKRKRIRNCRLLFLLCLGFSALTHAYDITTALEAYETGDYQTAQTQFNALALNDNPEAQYNLAFMYFGGEGVPQDDSKAAFWFERAAKLGHPAAQDTLAYLYLNGRGVSVDRIQAYAWYTLAAHNGVFLAKNVSERLRQQMNATERAYAENLSREYLEKYTKNVQNQE